MSARAVRIEIELLGTESISRPEPRILIFVVRIIDIDGLQIAAVLALLVIQNLVLSKS